MTYNRCPHCPTQGIIFEEGTHGLWQLGSNKRDSMKGNKVGAGVPSPLLKPYPSAHLY